MALITETVTINGKEYKHYYSDEGYYIKRNDNKLFMDVLQPSSSTNTYTETTQLATQSLIPRMMNRMSTIETNHNALANLPHIVETYNNGTDWYRVYSDKWCSQGSMVQIASAGQIVKLIKAYKNTNYTITSTGGTNNFGNTCCYSRTTSQFAAYTGDDDTFNAGQLVWQANGQIN